MEKDLHRIFQNSQNNVKNQGLSDGIWGAINKKRNRLYRSKIFSYVALGAFSISGGTFSIGNLMDQFSKLGFSEYFSLIFSDTGILATYWRDYVLTLIESFPIVNLTISLALVFVFFLSIERIISQVRSKLLLA